MRVGIFGGSFNPVHRGHIHLADAAASELNLDRIIFVPSSQNPLKKKEDLLPVSVRLRALKIATKCRPSFSVSIREITKKGPSYTVDTLRFFKRKYGKAATLYFLTGADVLETINRWRSVDEIFGLCRFVVMTRPGYPIRNLPKAALRMPFNALPLSSSDIRQRLKLGQDIKGLVPEGTEKILKQHRKNK